MLFFRRFSTVRGLTVMSGGHRKVWDYFEHVEHSTHYRPVLRTRTLPLAADNPWSTRPDAVVGRRARVDAAAYFFAGMNWSQLPRRRRHRPDRPVVNLVQHVRHASDDDPKSAFLHYPAVRVCISPEVAEAIRATGLVRGPIITIPNAVDVPVDISRPLSERDIDIALIGNKRPDVTRQLAARLERPGRRLHVIGRYTARPEFLSVLARARLVLFVPRLREGFYLPALEAMALGTPVVCPDVVGNRSFCIDGDTCWMAPYDLDALVARTEAAWGADPDAVEAIRHRAAAMAARHDPASERRAFLDVLDNLTELWAEALESPAPTG
jgi:hypothetical protein